jgi:predicted nucleotidyltransferase
VGVHQATLGEVVERFGQGARQLVTSRLMLVYEVARSTGKLEHMVVFGSYITAKADPNDVDILLVMRDDFDAIKYHKHTKSLFDQLHA